MSASLDLASLEALEAILRRVRFQNLRINSLELNDDAAVALFDMIEYYESTNTLSISCVSGLGPRSWQACSRLIKKVSNVIIRLIYTTFFIIFPLLTRHVL